MDCLTVDLTIIRVIVCNLRKVRVEVDMVYGSDALEFTVGKYLWGTLKANHVMNEFMNTQFRHHPEVSPHIRI